MKLKIDSSFILYILGLIVLNKLKMAVILIASLALHELGHVLALKIYNIKINELNIFAYGGVMKTEIKPNEECIKEIIIYFLGPLVNLFLFGIGLIFKLDTLKLINLILFLFNIIPTYPLDGYKIILNLLSLNLKFKKALFISKIISLLSLICLFIVAISINLYFLIIVIYLLLLNIILLKDNNIIERLALDKYLNSNQNLKLKEIKNPSLNIKNDLYKGSINYIKLNNKIYTEKALLKRLYKKNTNFSN